MMHGAELKARRDDELKRAVRLYWDRESCGTAAATGAKFSREYFEEIETYRYSTEPEIFSFAQFTRAHRKRVLEVGIGAGTDFLQWVRAGSRAVGLDLTREALANTTERLRVYGVRAPVLQSDCERLPFADDSFDVVYSWGVLHHTPRIWTAFDEIIRVCRVGGTVKAMIYNRHSVNALRQWIGHCVLKLRPWRPISYALSHHLESPGTRAYTEAEVRHQLTRRSIRNLAIRSRPTYYDRLHTDQGPKDVIKTLGARLIARPLGWCGNGWFLMIEFTKG